MDDPMYFCGSTATESATLATAWRKRSLAYAIRAALAGLSQEEVESAYDQAFASWAAVCGLAFARAAGPADIAADGARIDGPFNVLAWSELPSGDDRPLAQRYDTGEQWALSAQPPRGRIDLLAVMTHEIGHALGLAHAPDGSPDLMAPVYQPGRRTPQPGDVARIRALYGPPAAPPPPGGRGEQVMVIYLDGVEEARYRLVRIG